MDPFRFTHHAISAEALRAQLEHPVCGGYAAFEGWVRDHNEGRAVSGLEYEAFEPLALKEGQRIIAEAIARFSVERAECVHRLGSLRIGETAVWVGVAARHRHEAFLACRFIIDEVKHRVPIWKKEHYLDGATGWVNCERCAAHAHDHSDHDETGRAQGAAARPDYSRQMALKEIGAAGQLRLKRASVLVVGCGGLGVPAMTYLAGAGIGRLGLADADRLEASNLHRQPLYALGEVGRPKVELAAERLRALNPEIEIRVHPQRLDADSARELIAHYDLVIDCTDNIASKLALNDVCVQLGKPAVFASVYQYEGQLQVVRPDRGPCLRCVWPEAARDGLVGNCAEAGVLGPVPGTLGTLQALEGLKLLLDLPGQLTDELLILDLLGLTLTRVQAHRAADCPQHARAQAITTGDPVDAFADIEVRFGSLETAIAAGFSLIDIREPHEVAFSPAPCAEVRYIPMAQLLAGSLPDPASGMCLLVCAAGVRSLAAAQALRARGARGVYSLRGGLAALARGAMA